MSYAFSSLVLVYLLEPHIDHLVFGFELLEHCFFELTLLLMTILEVQSLFERHHEPKPIKISFCSQSEYREQTKSKILMRERFFAHVWRMWGKTGKRSKVARLSGKGPCTKRKREMVTELADNQTMGRETYHSFQMCKSLMKLLICNNTSFN